MKDNLTIFGGCLTVIILIILSPVLEDLPRVSTHRLWCFG